MNRNTLFLSLIALLGGCGATASFRSTEGAFYPPTDAGSVQVLHIAPQGRAYHEVGLVQADPGDFANNESSMESEMRHECAKHGSDAVVITGRHDATSATTGDFLNALSGKRSDEYRPRTALDGVCIAWVRTGSPTQATAVAPKAAAPETAMGTCKRIEPLVGHHVRVTSGSWSDVLGTLLSCDLGFVTMTPDGAKAPRELPTDEVRDVIDLGQ